MSDGKAVSEMRVSIAREVGFKPKTILTKTDLNSIYAYLTGEFLVKPEGIYKDSAPDLLEMRNRIANLCEASYHPGPRDDYPAGMPFDKQAIRTIHDKVESEEDLREYPERDDQDGFEWVEVGQ